MKAHDNPFRMSRAQALRFRGTLSLDELIARLAALGYRGAIVGPEGSGKTTLLRELDEELAAAGLPTRLVRFDDPALLRRDDGETILMIDGAEKLPWVVHSLLAMTKHRLVVTAHGRREGLPVLLECSVNQKLMEDLVIELAGLDPAVIGRARRLFVEKRGNAREVFAALYDLLAAWSPDSQAVIEVANSRWDSDSFAYYRIDGATATKLDLRALVEPVMTARLPPRNRQGNSFRVREDLPVTLDARGRLRFTAMLYVPKGETSNDYKVRVNIRTQGGKPSALVVSVRRVKSD